jgi:hypothetical protein
MEENVVASRAIPTLEIPGELMAAVPIAFDPL